MTAEDSTMSEQWAVDHRPGCGDSVKDTRLWHGGTPGLRRGDLITDDEGRTSHLIDGCPVCEARKAGTPLDGDDLDPGRVYVTSDREYARLYAAGFPRGDLYVVRPVGEMVPTGDSDAAPSWAVDAAEVLAVYDRCVTLTPAQLRRAARRWA
jgi:hypothetical protein